MDHKNFNVTLPEMAGTNPTSENIILMFWRVLEPAIRPHTLTRLRLMETENNYVEYDGRWQPSRSAAPAQRPARRRRR